MMMRNSFLLRRARPYGRQLLAISALSLASSLAILAVPWLAGQVFGGILDGSDMPLGRIVALLLVALLANCAFTVAAAILSSRTSGRILADLRCEAYDHVQSLSLGFHDSARQGDLLALMSYEVRHLSQFLTATLAGLPAMVLTAIGSVVLLFLIDPVVALIVPVLVPFCFVALRLVGRQLRRLAAAAREADSALMTAAEEDLEMLPAIKAFAVEEQRSASYADLARDSFRRTFQVERINAVLGPVVALVAALAVIALLIVANTRAEGEEPGAAELFSLLFYAALLTRPVSSLAGVYGGFQWAVGTLARLESVLAIAPEPGLAATTRIERARGAVTFDKVSFAYPERGPVLENLQLEISAGETVALTGLNGAGKSTMISLLLRFYEPDRGAILLDGTDIAGVQVQSLRRQIGLVPQSPLLFNGSIRDNIAMGAPSAGAAEIEAAMRLAQAAEFVAALPEGLETRIGDHGVKLSGGQRQRIALARALLPDPPILILDEATAMYDLAGEEAFVAACRSAFAGRTVIIITHRRASLALADRIVRIEGGKAVEGQPS